MTPPPAARPSCVRDAEGRWQPYVLKYAELRAELATATGDRRDALVAEAMRRARVTGVRFPADLIAF